MCARTNWAQHKKIHFDNSSKIKMNESFAGGSFIRKQIVSITSNDLYEWRQAAWERK